MRSKVRKPIALFLAVVMLLPYGGTGMAATKENTVPDVHDMPLSTARSEIALSGFNMKLTKPFAEGDVVGEQVPRQGTQLRFDGFVWVAPKAATPAQAPEVAAPAEEKAVEPKPSKVKAVGDATPEALPPLADGTYFLVVKAGQASQISAVRTAVLVGPGPGPTPPPGPGPVPTPNTRSDLFKAEAAKVAGDAARSGNARQLAVLYRSLAAFARPSGATPAQITDPLTLKGVASQGTDALLPAESKAAWAQFRGLVGTQWTTIDARPTKTIEDYAKLFDDVAIGLDAIAPGLAAPSPETIQAIIQIILMILKIFFPT